jgi:hypothetical protein
MELKHLMLMAEVHETLRLVVTEREIWKRAREHRANGNWGCPELNYVFSHGVYALLSRGLRRSRTIRLIRSGGVAASSEVRSASKQRNGQRERELYRHGEPPGKPPTCLYPANHF